MKCWLGPGSGLSLYCVMNRRVQGLEVKSVYAHRLCVPRRGVQARERLLEQVCVRSEKTSACTQHQQGGILCEWKALVCCALLGEMLKKTAEFE